MLIVGKANVLILSEWYDFKEMAFTKINFLPSNNRQNVKFEIYSSVLNMVYIIPSIALTIQHNYLYQTMNDNVRRVLTTLKINI